MTRPLYKWLILLHPPQFRGQFGEQMLCIFDETGARAKMPLLVDGLISLMRQWILRSGVWKWMVALAGAFMQMILATLGLLQAMRQMVHANPLLSGRHTEGSPPAGMLLLLQAGMVTAIIMSGMVLAVSINRFGFRRLGRTPMRKQVKLGRNQ